MPGSKRTQKHVPRGPSPAPAPMRASIRYDGVNPVDFNKYNFAFACEHCAHFAADSKSCTFGYNVVPHLHDTQMRSYTLMGRMAFCRFLEID